MKARDVIVSVICLVCCIPAAAQVNLVHGDMFTLTNSSTAANGAWSWYEDERVIIDDSDPDNTLLLLSSISAGSGAESGDVDLLWLNLNSGAQGGYELHNQLEQDDHDSASLYIRSDGRYVAMYAKHGSENYNYYRVSTNPNDPTSWGAEQTTHNGAGTTYSNTYYLANDNGGSGILYNFTRTINYDPTVQVSHDEGLTWSYAGKLLTEGGSGDRPYVKYASDGEKIYFITTERHPRNYANSIYSGYVQDGVLYNCDGTVMDGNVFDAYGISPSSLTTVFQNGSEFNGTTMNRAWTISMEMDNTGNPVAIFSARAYDSNQDHRFFYARFDGVDWQVNEMAQAGGYLYSAEDDYTGLVSIDPNNPNVVYMSTDIDPRTHAGTSKYELYKGVTSDFGQTWAWTPITENSTVDNLRPIVPQWNGQSTAVAWMRGNYYSYTNWDTEVVGISFEATDPKSLLWRGDAANPTHWDSNSAANWDSGGGVTDVFLDGAEVAFDDSASSYAVDIRSAVTPNGVAFNNSDHAYTITGSGFGGAGKLRVIGGGTVTLANGANTYTGETMIVRGTLAISGNATISNTPDINVHNGAMLDVTAATGGSYTLNNQTLTIDGDVNGDIVAANGSTVHVISSDSMNGDLTARSGSLVDGTGHITGDLSIESDATLRVGDDGLPTQTTFTYLDATHGVGGNTTLADGSVFTPTTNPYWQERTNLANNGQFYQGGSDDPDSAPQLKTTITGLTAGKSYFVYVNYWDADPGSTWRILAGSTSGDLTLFDSPGDYVSGATDGIDPDTLPYDDYLMTSESNRLMWAGALGELIADTSGEIAVYIDDTGTSEGDDRTWYDGLSYGELMYEAQSMTIDGNLTLGAGAVLQMDVYDPSVTDMVSVGGHLTAGGTLEVALDGNAPTLQPGDMFDILDFNTASGAFDTLSLPILAEGLEWDTTQLLTTGVIRVVDEIVLTGDLNGDGFVGLDDLDIVLGEWNNSVRDNHPADPSGDNYVGLDDLDIVLGNWNAGTPPQSNTNIPEPASVVFMGIGSLQLMRR